MPAEPRRVHLVSLGCPKNRVDSEVMLGTLLQHDFEMVDDPASANVIVVNTCSFIEPATEESIDTILEMGQHKSDGDCETLVVTGCMVQRYGSALEGELPEVDHFIGTGEYHRIAEILAAERPLKTHVDVPMYIHDELSPRIHSFSRCSAYLKISEGCNHTCTFCIIPTLRGRLRSRTVPSLVAEARRLASEGIVELNLVSQDSTGYGRDLPDRPGLGQLVQALSEVDGIRWIRLHYAYPHGIPEGLLEQLASNPKVCPYLDIPLQHASGPMLAAMRRGVTRAGQERILDRIRGAVPDLAVRTTFIVGFPGETEEDFAELCDFVEAQRFEHVGVFTYFREEGTPAATLPDQVPDEVKVERQAHLLGLQRQVSQRTLTSFVGRTVPVLLEGPTEESELVWRGRTPRQAPDVDGQVYLGHVDGLRVGEIRPVRIVRAADYDLVGEPVETAAVTR